MKKSLVSVGILLCVVFLFFWPIFKGFMPFPGDLLVDTNPYRSLSILGFNPGSYPNKAQGQDVIAEIYPWQYFSIQELKKGEIPFWNPHNFAGNVLMQNLQSSVFYPLDFVYFILPFTTAWTLSILFQPILATVFFFLFAREMKLSRFASSIGAIAFAFSSYMTVWIEYGNIAATFAYLPLLLFFILKFLKKQTVFSYVGFVVSAFLMLLSGYVQGAFYSYVLVAFFVLYLFFTKKQVFSIRLVFSLLGMFLFPVFLVLFQYLPTLTIFAQSTRWPYSLFQFQTLLQPVWYWITLFASDFFGNPATRNYYLATTYIERVAYVGIPILIFAVYAVFQKKSYTFFFATTVLVVAILTTNLPGISYLYLLPIPVVNTTVPTRMLSLFMFAMVVLATFGINEFFNKKQFPKKIMGIFLGIYGLLWLGMLLAKKMYPQFAQQISTSEHNLVIPTLLLVLTLALIILAKKFQQIAKALFFFLVVADLFYVFQKITPFAPPQTVYPANPVVEYMQKNAGINRYWGYGSGYIEPNFQTIDGTYSPEGNDPLHIGNYGELLASSGNGKISPLPPRPDANLASGYGQDGMKNPYRQTLLNLLGVKYIVQHDEFIQSGNADTTTFSPENYSLVWSQSPWQIYDNRSVLPRYFLVNNYVVANGQHALDLLYQRDLATTVILSEKPAQKVSSTAQGKVALIAYKPQRVTFATTTTGSMLLFLSDAYFPEWKVMIDGTPATLYKADYAFRAVVVPGGVHRVVMYYDPQSFDKGLVVSFVTLLGFLVSILIVKKYEKK